MKYPLTDSQIGMMMDWLENRDSNRYTLAIANRFSKAIDANRLLTAVESVINSEPIYKAIFVEDGELYWKIATDRTITGKKSVMSEEAAAAYAENFPAAFDAFNGPLVRFEVVESPVAVRLLLEIFHPITDGTSVNLLLSAIGEEYASGNVRPPVLCVNGGKCDFGTYAEQEVARTTRQPDAAYLEAKADAIRRFSGRNMSIPENRTAATTKPQTPNADADVKYLREGATVDRLLVDNSQYNANLLFMAAFARTLSLYTNEQDVCFWTVNHGRGKDAKLRNVHGAFVKTVPVLIETKSTVKEYIAGAKLHLAGAYPFTHFCNELKITPGWGFVYQAETTNCLLILDKECGVATTPMSRGANEFPVVEIYMDDDFKNYQLDITCAPGRYDRAFIAEFIRRMATVTVNLLNDSFSTLTSAEKEAVLAMSRGETLEYDREATFIDYFLTQVSAQSQAPAIVAGEITLTYAEVNRRADQFAAKLSAQGVAAGDFVGIRLPRGVDFPIATIAIQKCGAGYVPLDESYPQARLDYMIADSGIKIVIDEAWLADIAAAPTAPTTPFNRATPTSPAYMIYTSGSTGKPKGVVISQRALSAMIVWFKRDFDLKPGKRNLSMTSFSFDASVPDLFPPLAAGAALHILDDTTRRDLQATGDYCRIQRITGLTTSTQLGTALINNCPDLPLEYIMLGGERLQPFAKTPAKVLNGYGPTEFTVCSSYHVVDQNRDYNYPIGRAVPNSSSYILDRFHQPVPRGMIGEIALEGAQLADGYWHQPEKTQAAFIDGRIYLTGDLGAYNENGEIEYHGRIGTDGQVKLRGFRIEIGEIEYAAANFPSVNAVTVQVKTINDNRELVLYFEGGADIESLRQHLQQNLAPYMVPAHIIAMEHLPLTPNGKIDKNQLPLPEATAEDETIVEAENEHERSILGIVRSVIKSDRIGMTQKLRAFAVTSLMMMNIQAKLHKELGVKLTLRQLSSAETVRDITNIAYAKTETKPAANANPTGTQTREMRINATENQRGIFVDWLRNPDSTQYNMPLAFTFTDVAPEKLAAAVERTFAAHPAFATRFDNSTGELMQFASSEPIRVKIETTDTTPDVAFLEGKMRPFAPEGEALTRPMIFVAPQCVCLFIDVHHSIFDGISVGIFLNDLIRALKDEKLTGETFTAFDFAANEREYLRGADAANDENWFGDYLADAETTALATLFPQAAAKEPPENASERARRIIRQIPAANIDSACAAAGTTAGDWMLATFIETLKSISRNDDILINFVASGRANPDLADTIGMFVKTLPLRVKATNDANANETAGNLAKTAKQVHESIIDLLDRERVSYVKLSERFGIRPEIMFVFEGGIFELPAGVGMLNPRPNVAKAPLAVVITPKNNAYAIEFEYAAGKFDDALFEQLLAMYAEMLLSGGRRLVSAETERQLIERAYGGDLEYDAKSTFIDMFRTVAQNRPNAIAVVAEDRTLTYGELDRRSDSLAETLHRQGVIAGDFVGICLPRQSDFIVSAIAIQKCGAGYVPLDESYPPERLSYMISDSGAKAVINHDWLTANFNGIATTRAFDIASAPNTPAYMIYTSGSTGKPKGVVISQRALRNTVASSINILGITENYRTALHSSFSFDASVIDIFPTLAAGAELHIIPENLRRDLPGIRDFLIEHGITGITMTTPVGMTMVDSYPDLPLKYLQLGGEKMMKVAPTAIQLYNGYGPTEFCVSSSYEKVDQQADGDIPIGRSFPNTWSLVVDRGGRLLPAGFIGELVLIGPQLADGYWHQLEKTAAAFVKIPFGEEGVFGNNRRMYRTGDLARYNADDKLEYCGRIDFQVKLRGFRIEIGEIEATAKAADQAIVGVAAEVRKIADTAHLVLFFAADGEIDETQLKAEMAKKLPEYMIPEYFVRVDKMPLTANGKINRKALIINEAIVKQLNADRQPAAFVEPQNDTERKIAAIYAEILKCERFGAEDNFFRNGGTSLLAIKAVVALQKAGLEVNYGDLFRYKTPRALANLILGTTNANQIADEFANYDYSAIDKLLSNTATDFYRDFRIHSLGDVLLTGAVGYLGMHVLRQLLQSTDSTVTVIVRGKGSVNAERRVISQYIYYFGEQLPLRFRDRLLIVEGDITDDSFRDRLPKRGRGISTVINCAALVKHYIADDAMRKINIGGVERLIEFCADTGARLIQVSTVSVGGVLTNASAAILNEKHLYFGQTSNNEYIISKFLAERKVLEAIASGKIEGKIMRLGNLMGRESDGEFQMNVNSNAFVNALKSYRTLGVYPLNDLVRMVEMSPIDRVAEAIVLLSRTPENLYIFHPYNCYALDMGAIIDAMNRRGCRIDIVSPATFAERVEELRADSAHATDLQGILHYAGHLLENQHATPIVNDFTTTTLYRLGFHWKPAADEYLNKFFNMLLEIGVF